ncbi:DNA alkylation repair protein [Pedobacter gandavensis]|uniref:DNA alkylation repair protein n=1 Tax=Pedobacter gandavensis TaxID=2679963 RepID=A0ABR6ESH5_9SPHI|nr:DNA alkylation repair protein [Pedobacter gandavensis]MBB2148162.1 DNA alkylation repair protein [Pedobacter gandavensis]
MTLQEIMEELQSKGSDQIKNILLKHGVREPFFGVRVGDMKPIQKKVKMDYQLAKDLYATGNADAMYLAGLIADDKKMTKEDLQRWAAQALSSNISEYTVPWVTAGSRFGWELGNEWINHEEEHIVAAGWATLSNLVALLPDEELDLTAIRALLDRVVLEMPNAKNRVRYQMNSFVISVGAYIAALTAAAIEAANKLGVITIEMNGTACKVPSAADYILKIKDKGAIGKKKKTVKC